MNGLTGLEAVETGYNGWEATKVSKYPVSRAGDEFVFVLVRIREGERRMDWIAD